ncbi:MAG: zf-HC2 domain-containing protein [Acidobacteriaceae bacterium]|nr:zf-HC2 domain-containing protein [Acidobacteriaceae bacterium]MBV8572453.1 zf-HC2 domain-containing protein [Acidobacteriaceae bacterium]
MTCWSVKRQSTDYVDGRLRTAERAKIDAHLLKCDACEEAIGQIRSVRSSLTNLQPPVAPDSLGTRLRVVASQERRTVLEANGSRWTRAWDDWKFRINQFMRPMTIPATGGILSSVLLFSLLALTISTTTRQVAYEVPVLYTDHVDANLVPTELRSSVILTLNLDGKGRITDYAVQDGSGSYIGDVARLQYNNISLPQFPSVLGVSRPTSREIQVSFIPMVFRP